MVAHSARIARNSSVDGNTGASNSTRTNAGVWSSLAATWESDEYKADWGLGGINANYAYALGYTGTGVTVGVVDSGFDANHPELDQGNIHAVTTSGTYSAAGYRFENVTELDPDDPTGQIQNFYSYRLSEDGQSVIAFQVSANLSVTPDLSSAFAAGDVFNVPGAYDGAYNDPHGTHVTGTVGAARDGIGMHGVAFGADVNVANTDSTDLMIYGPNSDYNYFRAAYTAAADAGSRAINNSWGNSSSKDSYDSAGELTGVYQRFFGQKSYLDAAAEVAMQKKVIQVWAAGNEHYANPDIRSSLPYLQPDVEKDWLAVGASQEDGLFTGSIVQGTPGNVDVGYFSQLAGVAKYWTVFAPGLAIDSTIPTYEPGVAWDPADYGIHPTTDPDTGVTTYAKYALFSGTSMAAPHATGALAVIMQRYAYLDSEAARDILLTTAQHHDASDGTPDTATGTNAGLTLAADDVPNAVWGWGAIDLKAAMNGPGQFLGAFKANLAGGQSDLWTNRITEDALVQRKAEDDAEQATWRQTLKDKGWDVSPPTASSPVADQVAYEVGMARASAAASRALTGSLVKDGDGLLALDGADSTFSGGTALNAGALEIEAFRAAGLGDITFGTGQQRLLIDSADAFGGPTFTNVLDDFGYGDTIEMKWLDPSATAFYASSAITVKSGADSYTIKLKDAPLDGTLVVSHDDQGSTLLTLGQTPAGGAGGGAAPPAGLPSANPPQASTPPNNNSTTLPPGPTVTIGNGTDPGVTASRATLTLTGTDSAAGGVAKVQLYDGAVDLGAATLKADGTWSFSLDLGTGSHADLHAVVTDTLGQRGASPTSLNLTTGIVGEPYATTIQTSESKTGAPIGSVYVKPSGRVYLSASAGANSSGGETFTYSEGTFFRDKPYSSFADSYGYDGTLLTHVEANSDGSHRISGVADGQRLVSVGTDTFADNGASERFVFRRGAGAETITDFQIVGRGHDTIMLPAHDPGRLAQILANASEDQQGDTTLHLGHGTTLTLLGVTQSELDLHKSVFRIHA